MLAHLSIRDILILEDLALDLAPGLNVLTGETGAGKSILLDALGLVLGWRGRGQLVRPGAARGEVGAVFHLPAGHPALALLAEAGLPGEEAAEGAIELVLRRVVTAEGRKSGWVNERRVSAELLRGLGERLVELHGQHDERGLLDTRGHRALLDAFGGHHAHLADVAAAWERLRRAEQAREAAEAALAEARAEEDFLRHAVAELAELAPAPGEEAALDMRRRMMQGAVRLGEDIGRALAVVAGDGAERGVVDALRWLESVAPRMEGELAERLDPVLEALGRALGELGEATAGLEGLLNDLQFDPAELERVEERLFAIRALARKHRVQPDELAELGESLSARLAALDAGAEGLAAHGRECEDAHRAYDEAAALLSEARRAAAARLDAAVTAELPPLRLERASFHAAVTPAEPGPEGIDRVEFQVATNPGTPPGPLGRIASGGELSRFLLALKVCLARRGGETTMIFDEIDRGVGGATADAVGRRLAALAGHGQVIVVTHSPQVAARASHHLRVEKHLGEGRSVTRVTALSREEREVELARMLAGDRITPEARAAARALMKG